MRRLSACASAGAAALLILTAAAARGDDWPQFRRDGARTGASLDPVKFPLTDVWTWDTVDVENHSPLGHVAIWKDAAYFVAGDGLSRFTLCADARTGAVRWRQRLSSMRIPDPLADIAGPAVTQSGKVFAYDWQLGKHPPIYSVLTRRVPRGQIATHLGEIKGFAVRAYDARTGRLLDFLPLDALGIAGPPPQLSLVHTPHPTGLHPAPPVVFPAPPWRDSFGTQFLSQPLVVGEEMVATGLLDLFLRWTPGGPAAFSIVNHPLTGQDPDATPPSQFHRNAAVAVPGGILVSDDVTHRFMAVLSGTTTSRWLRDLDHFSGPPAADGDSLFVGLGGGSSDKALACLDAGSGQVRWLYAPEGLPPDRQSLVSRTVTRLARKLVIPDEEQQRPPRTTEELRAFTARALRRGLPTEIQPETLVVPQPWSAASPGALVGVNPVVADERVYAVVGKGVTALNQRNGSVLWRQPLVEGNVTVRSLSGAQEHLLVTFSRVPTPQALGSPAPLHHFLAALRKDTGKVIWQIRVAGSGTTSLAGGLAYLADGRLTAYAPAERTYRLAADSDDPKAYAEGPFHPQSPVIEGDERSATAVPAPPNAPSLPAEVRGDASVLRLSLDRPAEELLARARERRAKIGLVPLVIQLDWLNATRSAVCAPLGGRWTPERIEAFANLCGRIAEAAQPTHLDVAPEFNVYLRHHPEEGTHVLSLIRKAAAAAHAALAGCKVLATVDVEVVSGLYGQGRVLPYGELPKLKRGESPAPAELAQIVRDVDAIGLVSHPQSAFRFPKELPGDHLFRMRRWTGDTKPLLVLPGSVQIDTRSLPDQLRQASFAHRLLQACYWLNAEVVAPPRITLDAEATRAATALGFDPVRPEAERWRRALLFERVGKLTVAPPTQQPAWGSPTTDR